MHNSLNTVKVLWSNAKSYKPGLRTVSTVRRQRSYKHNVGMIYYKTGLHQVYISYGLASPPGSITLIGA